MRLMLRTGFFILFITAPILNIFRFDLPAGQLIVLGHVWSLGLADYQSGAADPYLPSLQIVLRVLLPMLALSGTLLWLAWRYGRLYCGWLCPHFSVVEIINRLMLRASGKPSLWEPRRHILHTTEGHPILGQRIYWCLVVLAVIGFSGLWSLVLLSYFQPPKLLYSRVLSFDLPSSQCLFLGIATLVFCTEFMLARHLFCRYGCAVGLFQSLAWMANKRALMVAFDGRRAAACINCHAACDDACPMRLKPRSIKRRMLSCTQCTLCISACETVQQEPLLAWVQAEAALQAGARDRGKNFSLSISDTSQPEHTKP